VPSPCPGWITATLSSKKLLQTIVLDYSASKIILHAVLFYNHHVAHTQQDSSLNGCIGCTSESASCSSWQPSLIRRSRRVAHHIYIDYSRQRANKKAAIFIWCVQTTGGSYPNQIGEGQVWFYSPKNMEQFNSLLVTIRHATSLRTFKQLLKTFLYTNIGWTDLI